MKWNTQGGEKHTKNGPCWGIRENSDMLGVSIAVELNRVAETELFMDQMCFTLGPAFTCVVVVVPIVPTAAGKESAQTGNGLGSPDGATS